QAIVRVDEALQLATREKICPMIIEVRTLKALLSSSLLQFDHADYELQTALKLAEDHDLTSYARKIEENIFFVQTQRKAYKTYDRIGSVAENQVRDVSFQRFRRYLRDIEVMARVLPYKS
ncbi:MAG: hypothetical protein ACFFB3_21620, partial [Candidatus Hodarchaeota archaeon]